MIKPHPSRGSVCQSTSVGHKTRIESAEDTRSRYENSQMSDRRVLEMRVMSRRWRCDVSCLMIETKRHERHQPFPTHPYGLTVSCVVRGSMHVTFCMQRAVSSRCGKPNNTGTLWRAGAWQADPQYLSCLDRAGDHADDSHRTHILRWETLRARVCVHCAPRWMRA
jgi:hypothetical protein